MFSTFSACFSVHYTSLNNHWWKSLCTISSVLLERKCLVDGVNVNLKKKKFNRWWSVLPLNLSTALFWIEISDVALAVAATHPASGSHPNSLSSYHYHSLMYSHYRFPGRSLVSQVLSPWCSKSTEMCAFVKKCKLSHKIMWLCVL